ncbi:hypothetical protein EV645_6536 [Kribbella rubisoli]|uniref:Uncharacterized protein n=1 Tax=Kribbella rubisoli TaxID=3075929 RepID=A0A4Q7WMW8_9ACTN|nr:hypothetical protein EV645_6536 [Kribbella rubisoli]
MDLCRTTQISIDSSEPMAPWRMAVKRLAAQDLAECRRGEKVHNPDKFVQGVDMRDPHLSAAIHNRCN